MRSCSLRHLLYSPTLIALPPTIILPDFNVLTNLDFAYLFTAYGSFSSNYLLFLS